MRIGFIGAGNMASAIIRGLVDSGTVAADDVVVTDAHQAKAQQLARETGIDVVDANEELVEQVGAGGLVVLAVKPQVIPAVLPDLRDVLAANASVVVSIAAGTTLDMLAGALDDGQPIVRVMPNVNAQVGAGMAAICGNAETTEEQVDEVVTVFEAVGEALTLPEKDFATYSAIAGCSPAFTFAYIDALARAAVRNGLPKAQAVRIAAQAVLGSAQNVLTHLGDGVTPKDLEDMVCSPAGTTIAGTTELDQAGFTAAVLRGVQAAIDRDTELSG